MIKLINKGKVVVIGDIFADMVSNIISYPNNGDATYGSPLKRNGGGTGGNVAAGLATLKADTSIICCLGDDETGNFLKDGMREIGVDVKGIYLDSNFATGVVIITVTPDGERTIFVMSHNSAYEKLTPEKISYIDEVMPEAIFVTGVMIGIHPSEETIFETIARFKGKSKIYFDPNLRYPPGAVPDEIICSMQKMGELCDVLLAGKSEMVALGLKPKKGQTFIVKDGKNGSYLLNEDDEVVYTVPATSHVAIDATGAGDTYAAAYIYAQINGKSIEESMRYATVASGISVTKKGARNMPFTDEIDEYLKNLKEI